MIRHSRIVSALGTLGLVCLPLGAGTLYDNGPPDEVNGYSNATREVFGYRRTVLDDFVVPDGATWTIQDFRWLHLWSTLPAGSGTGAELTLWSDGGARPVMPIEDLVVTSYAEEGTGRTLFDRPESESWVTFEDVTLDPGTYWIEWTVVGPEMDFVLTAARNDTAECWVNYEDVEGLRPGSYCPNCDVMWLEEKDLAWSIGGVPAPGVIMLLGLAALARSGRSRHAASGRVARMASPPG